MDRKEFLATFWKKGIKPIFLIVVIFFCVKFLLAAVSQNGPARSSIILTIGLGLIFLISNLISHLFNSVQYKVISLVPQSVQSRIRVIGKLLHYFSPILFGIIVYHFWMEDWITAALVLSALLVQSVADTITERN